MKKLLFYSIIAYLIILPLIGYCNSENEKADELLKVDAEKDPIACALFIAKTKLDRGGKEKALMDVASAYVRAGRLDQAFQVVQTIKDGVFKAMVLVEIVRTHVKAAQYDQALDITKSIKVSPYDADALIIIARAYGESGQFDQAIQAVEMIRDDYYSKAPALTEMAVYYALAGEKNKVFELFSRALEVTSRIKDLHYKDLTFDKVLDKSVEALEKDEALIILSQALKIAKTIEDDDYRSDMLGTIASKYAQLGQYEQAFQLCNLITGNKATLLAEIAYYYAKAGQTNKASKILAQAIHLAKKIKEDYIVNKDLVLLAIASKYAESGLYSYAIQIVKAIEHASAKAYALVEIARNYARAGQRDKASSTLSQALQVSELVKDKPVLTKIGCAYAELGLYEQAIQLAEMIKDDKSRVWSFIEIARSYVATEQRDKASKVLFQAFQLAKEIKNVSLLRVICEECMKAGQYDQAIEVAYALEDASSQAWFLADIGHAWAKAGQKDKASKILTQALEVSETIKDPRLTAKDPFFKKTVQAYAELGLYDRALQSVKMIKDISDQVELLAEIGGKYAESGQKVDDRIKALLQEIIREAEK